MISQSKNVKIWLQFIMIHTHFCTLPTAIVHLQSSVLSQAVSVHTPMSALQKILTNLHWGGRLWFVWLTVVITVCVVFGWPQLLCFLFYQRKPRKFWPFFVTPVFWNLCLWPNIIHHKVIILDAKLSTIVFLSFFQTT